MSTQQNFCPSAICIADQNSFALQTRDGWGAKAFTRICTETVRQRRRRKSGSRSTLAVAILLVTVASFTATAHAAQVVATPFGSPAFVANPTWMVTDFRTFTAPLGTPASGFAEFFQTIQNVFPAPNHAAHPTLGIVPGTAHAGPYNTEVTSGINAAGYLDQSFFTPAQFQEPNGVFAFWMAVPTAAAPTGSSPDFASGPIIPNSIFPIAFSGNTFRNGVLFDPLWSGATPATTAIADPTLANPGQGYSHFPFFAGEAFELPIQQGFNHGAATPEGLYVHQFAATDAQGNGWNMAINFLVVPEPAFSGLMGLSMLSLLVKRRRRALDPD
jgi:hypothetical protein